MATYSTHLKPRLTGNYLDRYHVHSSILRALEHAIPRFTGKFLDVGCGRMPYRELILNGPRIEEYVGLDLGNNIYADEKPPDAIWDGKTIPFGDEEFGSAMATEVLEHCPNPQEVIDEVYRILARGGVFFFTVPFLWPLHDMPHDQYRYTPFALQRMFEKSGFCRIEITPLGGWDASLAQMLGLWVNRRPLSRPKRHMLRGIVRPVIKYLLSKDQKPDPMTGPMITGLCGTVVK